MRRLLTHTLMIGTMLGAWAFAEQTSPEQRSRALELKELATPFKGITTNGQIEPGLFSLKSTGVSTDPVRKAAGSLPGIAHGGAAPEGEATKFWRSVERAHKAKTSKRRKRIKAARKPGSH